MKKLLLCFGLFFICSCSYGQAADYYLTFDRGSSVLSVYYNWSYTSPDTIYSENDDWISIDTINYHHNQWQIGRPQKTVFNGACSFPNAIITDTLHPCLPNDTSVFVMKMPENLYWGELSFEYGLNMDTGDIATIEISYDTGAHWVNLSTINDSIKEYLGLEYTTLNLLTSTSSWANFTVDFDLPSIYPLYHPYLLRFTLITDSNTSPRDGWMMDNFYIYSFVELSIPTAYKNNSVSLYPNPATTTLTIKSSDNIKNIIVTNVLGQVVYRQECNTQQASVNVADWPRGIYFVKINDEAVRKFLKE